MSLHISTHPLLLDKLAQLRKKTTSDKKFSELVEEMSMLLAYEAMAGLQLKSVPVQTPLAKTRGRVLKDRIALVPILRAGIGMVQGIRRLMPSAQVLMIGLARDEETLRPTMYYPLAGKPVSKPPADEHYLLDPMLATGGSAVAAINIIKEKWGATRITFIGLIAAPEGVTRLQAAHPDVSIYVAAVDERLTREGDQFPPGYILPGLGDAGDRQCGTG